MSNLKEKGSTYFIDELGIKILRKGYNHMVLSSELDPKNISRFILTNSKSQVGSVWTVKKILLNSNLIFKFDFSISLPTIENEGGDGLAFVMSSNPSKYGYLGGGGSGIGYSGLDGIVAVEFDTYKTKDEINEPNGNHISIQTFKNKHRLSSDNGCSINLSTPNFYLKDGRIHKVEIHFNHQHSSLSVAVDGIQYISNAIVTDLIGLNSIHLGLTSSTGSYYSTHTIHNFEIIKDSIN